MGVSYCLLASALWLATALCLPSAPVAKQPAEQAQVPLSDMVGSTIVYATGYAGHWLQMLHRKHERDQARWMGEYHSLELNRLDKLLDKETRPAAYQCMEKCITTVFKVYFAEDRFRRDAYALVSAYVFCQHKDHCNLDREDQLDPLTHRKRYPPPGQEERQRDGSGNGDVDVDVNEFRLLTEPVSNAAHRFAALAGQRWKAALAQGRRVEKAALRPGGRLQKALENDRVLQLVRHEG
ncbi:MAG: hypothetical protein M1826_005228 [Phylliscum demangeonii]|nr:MAG: hypothetical protein M1826_005228 [Phylliscum demangeonii]